MRKLGLVLLAALFAGGAWAQETTPAMVAAAEKEGKVVWYSSVDVKVAEGVKEAFKKQYPKIDVEVERTGSERVLQRINQEYQSNIHNVDVVNSSDASHFIFWKQQKWLARHTPPDVAKFPANGKDPEGYYFAWRSTLSPIAYNTKYVKPEDAPKSFADLLEPKWRGLIVKAHPGYSGTILTATAQIARELGWDYLGKLGKQRVMQVQSSTEPPKKLAIGERPIMADGNEYNLFTLKESGSPIEIVYPSEGTPFIASPSAVMAKAPHPNAARLLQSFLYTAETQQLLIDAGGLRSLHPATKEPAGRKPLREIKLFKDDAAAVVDKVEEIKANYAKAFGT